jgi:hypothetical protein
MRPNLPTNEGRELGRHMARLCGHYQAGDVIPLPDCSQPIATPPDAEAEGDRPKPGEPG